MSVGGARNSRSHTSHAKLVCEDALNAGVSARAAVFMPAPDHSPAPASRRCDGAQSGRYAISLVLLSTALAVTRTGPLCVAL